jgi:hypothetical protein
MGPIGRRRFLTVAAFGVLGGGSTVALLRRIDGNAPTFGADRAFVTMNGRHVGPPTRSNAEAQTVARWLNGGGYRALTS